jgi:hypothetical protein
MKQDELKQLIKAALSSASQRERDKRKAGNDYLSGISEGRCQALDAVLGALNGKPLNLSILGDL